MKKGEKFRETVHVLILGMLSGKNALVHMNK